MGRYLLNFIFFAYINERNHIASKQYKTNKLHKKWIEKLLDNTKIAFSISKKCKIRVNCKTDYSELQQNIEKLQIDDSKSKLFVVIKALNMLVILYYLYLAKEI